MAALAGLTMGFAAWTKDEGQLFALVLTLAFLGYLVVAGSSERGPMLRAFAAGAAAPRRAAKPGAR